MIAIEKATVQFGDGAVRALRSLSATIGDGEFVSVIGSNGAGKSTLLNAIAGEVTLASGRVVVDGEDLSERPVHRRAATIARIFQDPLSGTADRLSVAENMALAADRGRRRGFGAALNARRRRRFVEALAALGLGLEKRIDDPIGLLSGGQRQAMCLLMATLAPTRILLLDEHCAALDPRMARMVMDLTAKLIAEKGMSALMVTHSMAQALRYGDRLLMLHEGEILLDLSGEARREATVDDLTAQFERVRAADQDRLRLDAG